MSTDPKNGIVHFNGLKGAEFFIYGLLRHDAHLSIRDLTNITCYSNRHVRSVLKQLDDYQLISRHRERPGQRYQLRVKDGGQ
jgi:DNA-binding transcriptional regulator GbsR (MarR family)